MIVTLVAAKFISESYLVVGRGCLLLLRCAGVAGGGTIGGTGCGDVGTFAFLVGSAFALFAALFF